MRVVDGALTHSLAHSSRSLARSPEEGVDSLAERLRAHQKAEGHMGGYYRCGCCLALFSSSLFVPLPFAERATRAGEVSAVAPAAAPGVHPSRTGVFSGKTTVEHAQPSLLLLATHYRSIRLVGNDESFERVENVLARPYEFDFTECPLRDVASVVSDRTGLLVRFDHRALEDMGLDIDTTVVTSRVGKLPLKDGLGTILDSLDLALIVEDTGVVISARDATDASLEPRFYPIAATVDADQLITVIQDSVWPASWDVVGNQGHACVISENVGRGIVIRNCQRVHDDVERFLANLQTAAWFTDPASSDAAPITRVYRVEQGDTRRELGEKLVGLCNEALAHERDPAATVTVVGQCVIVSSRSRVFHVMAQELIGSISGAPLHAPDAALGMGGGAF